MDASVDVPSTSGDVSLPSASVDMPSASVDVPSVDASVDVPSASGDVSLPSASVDVPSGEVDASLPSVDVKKPKKGLLGGLFGSKKGKMEVSCGYLASFCGSSLGYFGRLWSGLESVVCVQAPHV